MTLTPQPAGKVLDVHYLEARARILDLAAVFDRIDRGGAVNDPRLGQLRSAVEILLERRANRAESVQEAFSLPYEPGWKRPSSKS